MSSRRAEKERRRPERIAREQAAAAPIGAVRLQLVLLYVLLGAAALAAVVAAGLAKRAFVTAEHQLREPPRA